jgi:transposase
MASSADSLPTDLASAHALIIAQREALLVAEAKARNAEAEARHRALLIEQMKFTIAKLRHEKFGQSSERGAFLEQLELALADMEEDASEAEVKAKMAAAAASNAKVKCRPSSAAGRRAGRCPSICRASASSIRCRRPVRAAAGPCTRSART